MALRNCDTCQRIFDSYAGARRCQLCLEQDEHAWQLVRDFVKSQPQSSIETVSQETGVPESRIREYIRSGLLEGRALADASYPCRKCGQAIVNGDYCAQCHQRVQNELTQSMKQHASGLPKPASGPGTPSARGSFVSQYRKDRNRF